MAKSYGLQVHKFVITMFIIAIKKLLGFVKSLAWDSIKLLYLRFHYICVCTERVFMYPFPIMILNYS